MTKATEQVRNQINIEVAYALPDKQLIRQLQVEQGTTAMQAVELSRIQTEFAGLPASADMELGIFSRKCQHDDILNDGDRVEIYRPLIIDPKEARRLKAEVAARRKAAEKAG